MMLGWGSTLVLSGRPDRIHLWLGLEGGEAGPKQMQSPWFPLGPSSGRLDYAQPPSHSRSHVPRNEAMLRASDFHEGGASQPLGRAVVGLRSLCELVFSSLCQGQVKKMTHPKKTRPRSRPFVSRDVFTKTLRSKEN